MHMEYSKHIRTHNNKQKTTTKNNNKQTNNKNSVLTFEVLLKIDDDFQTDLEDL